MSTDMKTLREAVETLSDATDTGAGGGAANCRAVVALDEALDELETLRAGMTPFEYVGGRWCVETDQEPAALVTYTTRPSPETGHVGWVWWARGKMGEAKTRRAAMMAAEASLRGGT